MPGKTTRFSRLQFESLEFRIVPTTWTVLNTSASGAGTLAAAVASANTDTSPAIIQFDASVFSSAKTINLSATLTLSNTSQPITIDGSGVGPVTINGGGNRRDFVVNSGVTATFTQLIITGGKTTSGTGGAILATNATVTINSSTISNSSAIQGGGIYGNGTLTVEGSTFTGNSAVGGATAAGTGSRGGAICWTDGTLTVRNASNIQSNHSDNHGGGIADLAGTGLIVNSTIQGNSAGSNGGGIYSSAALTIDNCTIGGSSSAKNSAASGGGIHSAGGSLTVQNNTTVNHNTATVNGGGVNITSGLATLNNCTFTANQATGSLSQGGGVYDNGTLTANNITVSGNSATSAGGGVYVGTGTLTLTNSSVSGNSAANGAGVCVTGADTVAGTDCAWDNNGFFAPGSSAPVLVYLPSGTGRVLTFSSVTGRVYYNSGGFVSNADGGFSNNNLGSLNGISGIKASTLIYLDGVFLNGLETGTQTAPASLDFTSSGLSESFASLSPLIDQSFFIGDGRTGTGSGAQQQFLIPDAATILVLGIVDYYQSTTPNAYGDNSGAFTAALNINGTQLGSATLTNCTVTSNTATANGAGIFNSTNMIVDGCTISGNTGGSSSNGGGIYSTGTLTVRNNTTVQNNSVGSNGGGVWNSGTANVDSSTFDTNTASAGAGLYNASGGTLSISSSTVSNNVTGSGSNAAIGSPSTGGAVAVTVINTVVSGTTGNGINVLGGEVATIQNCTFSGNSGTGISVASSSRATVLNCAITGSGNAGISVSASTATIQDCTISGNTGTGVNVTGASRVTVMNATVAANAAGGIRVGSGGTVSINHCTVTGNSATTGGGVSNSGTTTLVNSIVAGNSASSGPDLSGTFSVNASMIGNTAGSAIAGAGNVLNPTAPGLDVLGDNGGTPAPVQPPQTMPLLPGSPAIATSGVDTRLAAAIADTATTSITVNNFSVFAAAALPALAAGYFTIQVDLEEMLVTALTPGSGTTGTLTVVRARNSTTATSHAANAAVYLVSDERGSLPPYNVQPFLNMGAVNIATNPAGVIVTPTTLDFVVGDPPQTYSVVLTAQPSSSVTVVPATDSYETVSPATLVFDPGNWNIAQIVTVSLQDANLVGPGPFTGVISHATVTNDVTGYQGIAVDSVTLNIRQVPGVIIAPSTRDTTVMEATFSDTYSLRLTSPPSADVTIMPTPGSLVSVSPANVVFLAGAAPGTPGYWATPQTVTVNPPGDDGTYTGTRFDSIAHTVTSADTNYNGLAIASVPVTIIDNDGLIIRGTEASDTISVLFSGSLVQAVVNHVATFYKTGFPQVIILAGSGDDVIQLVGPNLPVSVVAGQGNDRVQIDGQTAANTFAIDATTVSVNTRLVTLGDVESVLLNGKNAADTFTVQALPAFTLTLQGWGGPDRITAPDQVNTWNITGADTGNLDGSIILSSIENLTGGSDDDAFVFAAGKTISGQVDGGGGSNTLDFSAYKTPIIAKLPTGASPLGAITGTRGFRNITTLRGGAGLDKLIGPNASNSWNITAANAGTVGSVTFAGFENLTGGAQDDTFAFADGALLTGKIDGGAGTDVLDLTSFSAALTVNLQARTATNTAGWLNLERFLGGAGADNLIGPNKASTWNLTGTGSGNISGGYSFQNFENLTGGTMADTFDLTAGGDWLGLLDGGAGLDTLIAAAGGVYTGGATGTLNGHSFKGVEARH